MFYFNILSKSQLFHTLTFHFCVKEGSREDKSEMILLTTDLIQIKSQLWVRLTIDVEVSVTNYSESAGRRNIADIHKC